MKKWLLLVIILITFGCGDKPPTELIRNDFQKIYPKAEIILITPLEKTSDTYRVNISYRSEATYRAIISGEHLEDVFLYRKVKGQWVMVWRKSSGK